MSNFDDNSAQQLLSDLAQALRDASIALSPLVAQLQSDGKWDDAQHCMRAQADLLNLSSRANAISVQVIIAADDSQASDLQTVTHDLSAKAAALAASEANVAHIAGIVTGAGQVIAALTGGGGIMAAASSLSGLVKLLR